MDWDLLDIVKKGIQLHPEQGDIFDVDTSRPWEFNTTFPIRSITLPFLTVGLPYSILKSFAPFINLWFGFNIKTPYVLLTMPRLVSCALSFVCDYSLYKICYAYGQNYRSRLITFASSYVVLIYGTRTFSNTTEMVLISLLLYLVADCMKFSDKVIYQDEYLASKFRAAATPVERVKFFKLRSALPAHSLSHCLAIASITVAGIFNRPTFIAFAFPPVFFWLHRGLGSKSVGFAQFHLRIFTLFLSGLPTVIMFILVDSFYYGYLTMNEILVLKVNIDNFVIAPVNFLRYNMNTANLAKHGLHPWFLHFLVNLPLLYNVLAVLGLYAFARMVYIGTQGKFRDLPRVQSILGLMTGSFIIPVAALSIFPHQEPRFLIPVTLPLIFLHAQRLWHASSNEHRMENGSAKNSKKNGRNILLTSWYVLNIILTLFYGVLHQGGVYLLMNNFASELQTKPRLTALHLITSHTYPLPLSLLQLRSTRYPQFNKQTGKRFKLARELHAYELEGAGLGEVQLKLEIILNSCEERWTSQKLAYRIYLALPGTLMKEFELLAQNANFTYSVDKVFYPHISTEALPNFYDPIECSTEDQFFELCTKEHFYHSPLKYMTNFIQQLGLALIRIKKVDY